MKNFLISKIKFLRQLVSFSLLLIFLFNVVYAQDEQKPTFLKAWEKIRSKFIDTLVSIGLAIVLLVIISGGICLLASLGGIEVIGTTNLLLLGKDLIKAGFSALLILLCFYSLMSIINPQWTNFSFLSELGLPTEKVAPFSTISLPTKQLSYQEVPLGTLTENVLAKGIDCFWFNPKGDIDDADGSTPDIFDPLIDNDRYDCAIRVAKAIEIKEKELIRLTRVYAELLKECNCSFCQCQCAEAPCQNCALENSICNCATIPIPLNPLVYFGICRGPIQCACPRSENPEIPSNPALCQGSPCSPETYKKITEFWYKYFYTPEDEILNRKTATPDVIIKLVEGNYFECLKKHSVKDCSELGWVAMQNFQSLTLYWQIYYLNAKLTKYIEEIQKDVQALKEIKSLMESDYLIEPYIEFIKIAEEYQKKYEGEVVIKPYYDYNHSRYCKGFVHLDLQEKCPGDSWLKGILGDIIGIFSKQKQRDYFFDLHFKSCLGVCTAYCREQATQNNVINSSIFFKCIKDTEPCQCTSKDSEVLQQDCQNCEKNCFEKANFTIQCENWKEKCYSFCEKTEKQCKEECTQFLVGHPKALNKCYEECEKEFNKKNLLGEHTDQCHNNCLSEYDLCIAKIYNQYLFPCLYKCYGIGCRYCTDQYSVSYEECYKTKIQTIWDFLQGKINLFNWQNRDTYLKTPLCYQSESTFVISPIKYPGIEQYPENAKCVSCSSCPECPCTTCSGHCAEYAYDGDPLTFYSRISPPPEEHYPGPLGEQMICDRKKEIPLGRLVDETIQWPEKIIEYLQRIQYSTEISFLIVDSIQPYFVSRGEIIQNFSCKGRAVYLKETLKTLIKMDPEKVSSKDLAGLMNLIFKEAPILFKKYTSKPSQSYFVQNPKNSGISFNNSYFSSCQTLSSPGPFILSVETLLPSSVGSNSAILKGKITEDGLTKEEKPEEQFYDFRYSGPDGKILYTPCMGPITPSGPCQKCNNLKNEDEKKACQETCKEITFSYFLTGLLPETNYKFSACICNISTGRPVSCGQDISFTTEKPQQPGQANSPPETKTLQPAVGSLSAILKGEIINSGGGICQRYFLLGQNPNSLTTKKEVSEGIEGVFSATITGLEAQKNYYFKACAKNSKGESCGEVLSFKTEEIKPPEITAPSLETLYPLLSKTTAILRGNIVSSGGEICERFFLWGENAQNLEKMIQAGNGQEGNFSATISGLTLQKNYYFKACAKNSKGQSCGNILSFKIQPPPPPEIAGPPEVVTLEPETYSIFAILKGEVKKSGGEFCERWFEFSQKTISAGSGMTGEFRATAGCLVGGKNYSFRACAKNSKGQSCGNFVSFTTKEEKPSPPSVSCLSPKEIKGNSAVLVAQVTNWGGSAGSCRFFYGKKQEPCEYYTLTPWQNYQNQCETITYNVLDLQPNTTYRVIAQCQNSEGKGQWSNWYEFKTCGPPEGKTLQPEITPEKVIFKGELTQTNCEKAQVHFSWGYDIKGTKQSFEEDWLKDSFDSGQIFEQTITVDGYGLPEGKYWVKAYAKNSSGETDFGTVEFNVDYEHANPIPTPPSFVSVFARNQHSIEIIWENGYKADQTIIVMKKGEIPPKSPEDGEIIYPFANITKTKTPLQKTNFFIQSIKPTTFFQTPSGTFVQILPQKGNQNHLLIEELAENTNYSFSFFGYNTQENISSTQHTFSPLTVFQITEKTKEPYLRCETGCSCCKMWVKIPIYWKGVYIASVIKQVCGCQNLPCQGDPTNIEKEIKGLEKLLEIIKYNLKELEEGFPSQVRSELLKQLVYSRKMINQCSEIYVETRKGPEREFPPQTEELREETKLLSCTRAQDEILLKTPLWKELITVGLLKPPACYGAKPNAFEDFEKTDDWFCCTKVSK